MKKFFNVAICILLGSGGVAGCRGAAEKPAEKAVEKGSGGNAEFDFDEKNKTLTLKTKEGSMITRAEPGGGTKKIEITDARGNVTQSYEGDDKAGKVTVKDKRGNVSTYEAGVQVAKKDLGIALYKNAHVVSGTRADSADFGSATQVVLETTDTTDAVKAFYDKAAPRGAFTTDHTGQDGRIAVWSWQDGAFQYSVTVSDQANQGKVTVTLSKVKIQ